MKKIYNKLVRDKMVDIYEHDIQNKISASDYKVRYMEPAETLERLKDKLLEESKRFLKPTVTKIRLHLKKKLPTSLK